MNILRFFAIAVIAYLGVRLIRRIFRLGPPPPDPMKRARTIEGADMVKDPACGLYTPRDSAIADRAGGETMYFCSERCRKEYAGGKRAEK